MWREKELEGKEKKEKEETDKSIEVRQRGKNQGEKKVEVGRKQG